MGAEAGADMGLQLGLGGLLALLENRLATRHAPRRGMAQKRLDVGLAHVLEQRERRDRGPVNFHYRQPHRI